MDLLSQIRHPTKFYAKLVSALLALVFFFLLATATVAAFLLYRIVEPPRTQPTINTRDFPGHPEEVTFDLPGIGPRKGWFFPGLRHAPTIVLCHGYQSNRGELLILASALQDNQFNVFLFDFAAHGSTPGRTTLGFREAQELRAAIAEITGRTDVDHERFGLWGESMGAYVALAVAETDPRVRALVADSVYNRPLDLLRLEVQRSGLGTLPMIRFATDLGFGWMNEPYRHELPLSARLGRLAGVPKLFILASDAPELAASTHELFFRSPEPREEAVIPRGNYAGMNDEDRRSYENRIVTFFLANLPPSSRPRR
jgi:pimeloyl-ACP methyl ester carboxylesterase